MLINKLFTGLLITLAMMLTSMTMNAQVREITGKISDDSGPLTGVTVKVKDTSTGTFTDIDGSYKISVKDNNAVLVFSFLGYETVEKPVGNQTTIDVLLNQTAVEMDELVVVGYGIQRKSHLTGAITKFDPQAIIDVPTSDIATALQGRLSGVTIQNISSEVGVAPEIRVRGAGAMNSGNSPLIVVDNFVMENGLQIINPSDIASIEVLKDASSAAIYGSRAANGVIIITTKEGSAMNPKYSANVYSGLKFAYKLHPMMTYSDYVDVIKNEHQLGGIAPHKNDLAAAWIESNIGPTDWQKEGLRSIANTTSAQINISGGRTNLKYMISGGFVLDEGLMEQNHNNKFNFRSKLDVELSKSVTIGTNMTVVYTDSQRPVNNFVDFMRFPQFIPVYHNEFTSALTGVPVGTYAQPSHFNTGTNIYPVGDIDPVTGEPALVSANPYNSQNNTPGSVLSRTSRESKQYQLSGNAYMNIKFTRDLVFRTANSVNLRYNTTDIFSAKDANRVGNPAQGSFTGTLRTNWTSDNTLTYLKKFGDHDLNVMAGISVEQWKTKLVKLTGTGYPNDYVKTLSAATSFMVLDANGNRLTTSELLPDENLFSYLGRVNYGYKDRYLLSAVLRADGFSYFGDNQKWGYFPSLSLGWRVTEENFMKRVKPISSLKLRASYGLTGDNSVPYNATKNLLYSTLYSFGEGTGSASTGLANTSTLIGNPDLGWAKTREVNLGMDLGLINNRINLTMDYYYSTTQDMLFLRPAASLTGHTQYWTNEGKVRNKGLEITLETINFSKKDFSWSTTLNFSMNRNKLLDLGGEERIIKEGTLKERYANIVGQPAIQFYGYKTDGVWLNQQQIDENPHLTGDVPGGLRIVNMNGDNEITPEDMTVIGNPYPDFTWGITNSIKYKNFDFQVLIQGVQGGEVMNGNGYYKDMKIRNSEYNIRNRWVSEAHVGDGRTPTLYGVAWEFTDYLIEDASYVALRNVTVGYKLPSKAAKKLHLKGLRFYMTGNNLLFLWSKSYRGINPEYRNTSSPYDDTLISGHQRGGFPLLTTLTAGFDINF